MGPDLFNPGPRVLGKLRKLGFFLASFMEAALVRYLLRNHWFDQKCVVESVQGCFRRPGGCGGLVPESHLIRILTSGIPNRVPGYFLLRVCAISVVDWE